MLFLFGTSANTYVVYGVAKQSKKNPIIKGKKLLFIHIDLAVAAMLLKYSYILATFLER